jgi:hypothetical protein
MTSQNNSPTSASNLFTSKKRPSKQWLRSELSAISFSRKTQFSISKTQKLEELMNLNKFKLQALQL